jgi:hypothetical protein
MVIPSNWLPRDKGGVSTHTQFHTQNLSSISMILISSLIVRTRLGCCAAAGARVASRRRRFTMRKLGTLRVRIIEIGLYFQMVMTAIILWCVCVHRYNYQKSCFICCCCIYIIKWPIFKSNSMLMYLWDLEGAFRSIFPLFRITQALSVCVCCRSSKCIIYF